MKNIKKKRRGRRVPDQIIAVRHANREIEQEMLGDGFHVRERAVKNKKRYTRKVKHKNNEE